MINPNFIKDTNEIIEQVKKRGIRFEHGNVLVAKVKMERVTKSGIVIADDYADREEFKQGFARILALPSGYDGALAVGQYVMFAHESRYKPYITALREILGLQVIDDFLYTVQDNNVILTIDAGVIENGSN